MVLLNLLLFSPSKGKVLKGEVGSKGFKGKDFFSTFKEELLKEKVVNSKVENHVPFPFFYRNQSLKSRDLSLNRKEVRLPELKEKVNLEVKVSKPLKVSGRLKVKGLVGLQRSLKLVKPLKEGLKTKEFIDQPKGLSEVPVLFNRLKKNLKIDNRILESKSKFKGIVKKERKVKFRKGVSYPSCSKELNLQPTLVTFGINLQVKDSKGSKALKDLLSKLKEPLLKKQNLNFESFAYKGKRELIKNLSKPQPVSNEGLKLKKMDFGSIKKLSSKEKELKLNLGVLKGAKGKEVKLSRKLGSTHREPIKAQKEISEVKDKVEFDFKDQNLPNSEVLGQAQVTNQQNRESSKVQSEYKGDWTYIQANEVEQGKEDSSHLFKGGEEGNSSRTESPKKDLPLKNNFQTFIFKEGDFSLRLTLNRARLINLSLQLSTSYPADPKLVEEIKSIISSSGFIPGKVYLKVKGRGESREKTSELRV